MTTSNVTPIHRNKRRPETTMTARDFRDQIVGKTILAVVAKPGRAGQPPMVLMMQFDDGTVVEWVSPRSDTVLRRALSSRSARSTQSALSAGPEYLQLPLGETNDPHVRA